MPAFDVYDTVVLKDDSTLIGTIERTAIDAVDHTSLEDLLIVNYTNVPERVLIDFVNNGVPPRGYVFVICVDEERGAFLAHEDDLSLLSRSFDLGETVKRVGQPSSMIGTVINYIHSFTLDHVFHQTQGGRLVSVMAPDAASQIPSCGPACPSDGTGHYMLENVPAEEITRVDSVYEGHLAVHDDWVGSIEDSDFDIVLRLANDSVVILRRPQDLHVPIRDPEKPLVSLPEIDHLPRPTVLSAFQGWSTIPAQKAPRLGCFVTTSRETLSSGRWVKGEYAPARWTGGPSTPLEGIVIDVIPRAIDTRWITPNPFTKKHIHDLQMPSARHTIFKNINTFRNASELKPRDVLKICDSAAIPSSRSHGDSSGTSLNGGPAIRSTASYQSLRTGDQVRFRDPTAAAVKYAGKNGTSHAAFRRIHPSEDFDGWDLNVLRIVSTTQQVVVQWQDGSETKHEANSLYRFAAFESALTPGQVVLNRAGLRQAPAWRANSPSKPVEELTDFNEMAFFERPHDLVPSQVGIVQTVDHEERIATVRWFQQPNLVLLEAGELIHPESRFGSISDRIEDVSLYEIMTFPAFDKQLRDFVLLPPNTSLERLRKNLKTKKIDEAFELPMALNPALDFDRLISRAKMCIQHWEETKAAVCSNGDNGDGSWIGEIVGIGLDGILTVRMRGGKTCRDIRIPLDIVLASINVDELVVQDYDADDDLEEWWEDYVEGREDESRSPSPISESIEYEGGARLDEDEDDEAWMSAEEDHEGSQTSNKTGGSKHDSNGDEDVEMADASTQTAAIPVNNRWPSTNSNFRIREHWTPEAPAPFEILDISPPPDQYSADLSPSTSSNFLKRIRKEHTTLASALPAGQIYVRTYESRLDLLRCLIIGPRDTPYEDAPFVVDLYLGAKFPDEPPIAHFHSWTSGLGRINPNLYEEGKICLSLLGTWPGKESGEGWTPRATILQLLVSLQGLVLVRNPFFNEAGFEGYEAEGAYKTEAAQYAEKAFVMARGFVKHALERPPVGLEGVLAWLYLPTRSDAVSTQAADIDLVDQRHLLTRVLRRGTTLYHTSEKERKAMKEMTESMPMSLELTDGEGNGEDPTKTFLRPLSKGALIMLARLLRELADVSVSNTPTAEEMLALRAGRVSED